jgi:hypothetical protein
MLPSLPKLIGLAAIIWLVWTAFRIFETRQAAIRDADKKSQGDDNGTAAPDAGRAHADDDASVDLRECKTCAAWVSGENCGRENCPY